MVWMRIRPCGPSLGHLLSLHCSALFIRFRQDMPSTELELYERRFELLLRAWRKAKRVTPRIQPLSVGIRRSVFAFFDGSGNFTCIDKKSALSVKGNCSDSTDHIASRSSFATPLRLSGTVYKRGLLEWMKEVVLPLDTSRIKSIWLPNGWRNTTHTDLFGAGCWHHGGQKS